MNILSFIFDFIIHIDKYLAVIIQNFGLWAYGILFLIIFLETGLVVTPFLPGDSLIFVAGTFASQGIINVFILFIILTLAAILGDTLNYWIGNFFGERVFSGSRFFSYENLQRTKDFYERHGGKTIIIARFIPIIRTFAPFVAGIGKMKYSKFLSYNIVGGVCWVALFLFSGFWFGAIPFVQKNLSLIIFIIIFISIIPSVVEYFRHRKEN